MSTHVQKRFVSFMAVFFIFLFVYTAVSKLWRPDGFEVALQKSPLLQDVAPVLRVLIPLSEVAIAILLIIPALRMAGFISTFLLMSLFTFYIGYMILFEPQLPCSCGGIISQLSWHEHLGLNILLTLCAGISTVLSFRNEDFIAINRSSRKPVEESRLLSKQNVLK